MGGTCCIPAEDQGPPRLFWIPATDGVPSLLKLAGVLDLVARGGGCRDRMGGQEVVRHIFHILIAQRNINGHDEACGKRL